MRIVAGKYRSRKIMAPEGLDTRPTLDQVREAVFSSLGGRFDGGNILDLFAGSGAIGLEGISRGMAHAVLCDKDPKAVSCIRNNVSALAVKDQVAIWPYDYHRSIERAVQEGWRFDWVYLDPPYRIGKYAEVMELIARTDILAPDAIVIAESLREEEINPDSFRLLKQKNYGIMKVGYYARKS